MNHTQTAFGARLLRKWLQQPLLEKKYGLPQSPQEFRTECNIPC
jgi:hypothetical protein